MPIWETRTNGDELLSNFISLLEKEVISKGSFQDDYDFYCNQFKIVRCPFIKSNVIDGEVESVKVLNCISDLSSWRAALLACCTVGSKVVEFSIHQSKLTPVHILDLAKAAEKSGMIQIVKLQYLSIDWDAENKGAYIAAFISLLNDITGIEYLSFKGNKFGDKITQEIIANIGKNFKLKCVNLADNDLTDAGAQGLLQSLRLNTNIKDISLAKNNISGDFINTILGPILLGTESANGDDEAAVKASTKYVTDRNKQIKDLNKKRKKAGFSELLEYQLPGECITKRDGGLFIFNQSFNSFDISGNPIEADQLHAFVESINSASTTLSVSASQIALICKEVNIAKESVAELKAFECPWIRIVLN